MYMFCSNININYPIRGKESSSNTIRSFPSQSSVRKKIHGFYPGVLCVIRRAHLNEKKSKRWDVLGCLSSLLFPRLNFLQQLWVCSQGNAPSPADWPVSSWTSQKGEGGSCDWLELTSLKRAVETERNASERLCGLRDEELRCTVSFHLIKTI